MDVCLLDGTQHQWTICAIQEGNIKASTEEEESSLANPDVQLLAEPLDTVDSFALIQLPHRLNENDGMSSLDNDLFITLLEGEN